MALQNLGKFCVQGKIAYARAQVIKSQIEPCKKNEFFTLAKSSNVLDADQRNYDDSSLNGAAVRKILKCLGFFLSASSFFLIGGCDVEDHHVDSNDENILYNTEIDFSIENQDSNVSYLDKNVETDAENPPPLRDLESCTAYGNRCGETQECINRKCVDLKEIDVPKEFYGFHLDGNYRLRWVDSSLGEELYRIERRTENNEQFSLLAELPANTTEYIDVDFSQEAGYVYRVTAVSGDVHSEGALCDSRQKLWTYIRIIDYDGLWGNEGPSLDALNGHLRELEQIGSSDNINLVLLGDAYGDTGSLYAHINLQQSEVVIKPELEMNQVSTYRNFFKWVVNHHPGQRYVIEFWGHGGGVSHPMGILGYDATSNGNGLSPSDVADALGHLKILTGQPIDLFYLCTCINGMFENAYEWKDVVRYFVSGETNVGCIYQPIGVLEQSLEMSVSDLAVATVEKFSNSGNMNFDVVYSAIDNYGAESVAAGLDHLANALLIYFEDDDIHAEQLRDVAYNTQNMQSDPGDFQSNYIDLFDFCVELTETIIDANIQASCASLMIALKEEMVMTYAHTNIRGDYRHAHGLSIFHPNENFDYLFPGTVSYYSSLKLSQNTSWDEYIFMLYP